MSDKAEFTGGEGASLLHYAHGSPRVMVVADHFGYADGVIHGVTTYFLDVLPALVSAGVDLTVCVLRDAHPAAVGLREQGVDPVFLSAARLDPRVLLQIVDLARRSRSTILHAAGIKSILMARLATRMVPAQMILHLHDLIEPVHVVAQFQRMLARRSDIAVCVSEAAVPTAIRCYDVSPDRVRVIHNGIRLERFQRAPHDAGVRLRASIGIPADSRVLLLVGRMHPIKGHRTMLRLMPEIVRRCPDVVLLVAGDGPERAVCEKLVLDLGLAPNVRFLGQRRDVPDLLHGCDVVVIPSESEGLSLAAIEAHASGKPVVGFDAGGIVEVVQDGITGCIVPAADSAAFANATVRLLLDKATRAEFGSEARRVAQRFSLDAHVESLLRCYRELDQANTACPETSIRDSGAEDRCA